MHGPWSCHIYPFLSQLLPRGIESLITRQGKQPQPSWCCNCHRSKYWETPCRWQKGEIAVEWGNWGNALGEIQPGFILLLWWDGQESRAHHVIITYHQPRWAPPTTLPWPTFTSGRESQHSTSKNSIQSPPQGRSSPIVICKIWMYSAFYTSDMYVYLKAAAVTLPKWFFSKQNISSFWKHPCYVRGWTSWLH